MGNSYYSGSFSSFLFDPSLTLKRSIKYNKAMLSEIINLPENDKKTSEYKSEVDKLTKMISGQEAELLKQKTASETYKFDEGKNEAQYREHALDLAKEYIKSGDTDGDGTLSKAEYLAMQKANAEKLDAQTGGKIEGAKWDDSIHSQMHGNVFDALNTQSAKDGKTEALDEKELATYFSYTDASDDKMDGKINFNTANALEERLADTTSEKRNSIVTNLKGWYNSLFPQQ